MKKSPAHGFTLIELMVAIAVLAVLLGLAVPSFTNVMNSNRVATSANDILTALSVTRSEAVKRAIPVAICPANATFTACVDSFNWSTGWIAFTDDGATPGVLDATETRLQVWPAQSSLTITNNLKFVRYLRDGSRDGATDSKVQLSKSSAIRCVTVMKPGRTNLTKVACP